MTPRATLSTLITCTGSATASGDLPSIQLSHPVEVYAIPTYPLSMSERWRPTRGLPPRYMSKLHYTPALVSPSSTVDALWGTLNLSMSSVHQGSYRLKGRGFLRRGREKSHSRPSPRQQSSKRRTTPDCAFMCLTSPSNSNKVTQRLHEPVQLHSLILLQSPYTTPLEYSSS